MDFADILDRLLRPGGSVAGAPDIVTLLGSALGLGFLTGFRLYATVAALGLAIRFHWFTPNETMSAMNVLAEWKVLGFAGVLAVVEFLADKVPWVDSAWDSVHTFIRPVAAVAVASTALGSIDPVWKTIIALLCGGVAFTTHSAKAATRFAVNHSPEPFSNWMLSAAEDLAAPLGLWFLSAYPGVFLAMLIVILGVFAYALPKLLRQIRLSVTALRSVVSMLFGIGPSVRASLLPAAEAQPKARELWNLLRPYMDEIPQDIVNKLSVGYGVRAAAARTVVGLHRSIGHLCLRDKKVTFMARRFFKTLGHSVPYTEIKSVSLRKGIFLDQLTIEDSRGQRLEFDLFKVSPNGQTEEVKLAATAASS